MFQRNVQKESVSYTALSSTIITKIEFDWSWSSGTLRLMGKINKCSNLKKFDKGDVGGLHVFSGMIKIDTASISREEVSALFEAMNEYDTTINNIKEELLDIIFDASKRLALDSKTSKRPTKSSFFNLDDIIADLDKELDKSWLNKEKKDPVSIKELEKMYERLFKFGGKKALRNIKYETTTGALYRTVNAHYKNPDFRIHDEEHICRTTMLGLASPIEYIEYKTTPEINFGEDSNGSSYRKKEETHRWAIAFKTKDAAEQHKKCLPGFENYTPRLFASDKECSTIFYINQESIDGILDSLVKAKCCPEEAVANQKEQIKEGAVLRLSW